MTPYILLSLIWLVLVLVAWGEAYRRGKRAHPETRMLREHISQLNTQVAAFNTEAEDRETRAYERGRLDQAEVESARRSASALVGAATRRDRRVNRLTGETKPGFANGATSGPMTVQPTSVGVAIPTTTTGAPTDA